MMAKKQQDFTKTIEWETKQEPTVLAWQIKTIGHQWQKLGYFCIFVISVLIAIFFAILIHGFKDWGTPVLPLIGVFVFGLGLFGEVRRKTWFVYRFIDRGAEVARWRAYPKILFVLIRWLFAILGVVVMIIGIAMGETAIAMVGPVGVILSLGTWAITKNYQETMTAFLKMSFTWDNITQAQYDKKRNVIMLHTEYPPVTEEAKKIAISQGMTEKDFEIVLTEWDFYLFLTPEITEQALSLTKKSLINGVVIEYTQVTLPDMI